MEAYTEKELKAAELKWGFKFPPDLFEYFLKSRRIVSAESKIDWVHSPDEKIRKALRWPFYGLWFDVEQNGLWLPAWGARPEKHKQRYQTLKAIVDAAPRLIPLHSHRYLPAEPHESANPVFSVYQSDIIHYGANLADYIRREESGWDSRPWPIAIKRIPFWTDVVEYSESSRVEAGGGRVFAPKGPSGVVLPNVDAHALFDKDELIWKGEAGDAASQYALAHLLNRSESAGDGRVAERWLEKAAENGHAQAQFELGLDANQNIGAVFDSSVWHFVEDAIKWLGRAAENGHAEACMELAEVLILSRYNDPVGVAEGAKWYQRGRELGHDHDAWKLNIPLSSDPYPDAKSVARALAKKAAEQGSVRAQFNVGCFCAHSGSDADMVESYAWFWAAGRELKDKSFEEVIRIQSLNGMRRSVAMEKLRAARSARILEKTFNDDQRNDARHLAERFLEDHCSRRWWRAIARLA